MPVEAWGWVRPRGGSELRLIPLPEEAFTAIFAAFFVGVGEGFLSTFGLGAGGASAGLGSAFEIGVGVGQVAAGAAVSFGTSALSNGLIDMPSQDTLDGASSPSPTLSGRSGAARPGEPFPYVAGTFRLQPPLGSFPFTVVKGEESVFYATFLIGKGEHDYAQEDVRIGEIPLTDFPRALFNLRKGLSGEGTKLTIVPGAVFQASPNASFPVLNSDDPTLASAWAEVRVPGVGHDVLGVDLTFPQGLLIQGRNRQFYTFDVEIQFRKNGGSWQSATANQRSPNLPIQDATTIVGVVYGSRTGGSGFVGGAYRVGFAKIRFEGQSQKPFQFGYSFVSGSTDPSDVFDIRMRRVEIVDRGFLPGGGGAQATIGAFAWFAAKGLDFNDPPITDLEGTALIELEVPLDEQFSGIQNGLTVECRRRARIYDPGDVRGLGVDSDGWTLTGTTFGDFHQNPAAVLRDILQGSNNRRPIPDSKLDIASLTAWYVYCGLYDDGGSGPLRFNFVFDNRQALVDVCRTVCSAGRARFIQNQSGQYSVTYDGPLGLLAPAVKINAANSRGFRMRITVPRELHAIRTRFVDAENGYDPNAELIVYQDGYDASNTDEAFIETVDLPGTTRRAQAYILGRYLLATRSLRRRTAEVEMGIEQLEFGVGTLISFSHPGSLIGRADGRIKSASSVSFRDQMDADPTPYAEDPHGSVSSDLVFGDGSGLYLEGHGCLKLTSQSGGDAAVQQDLAEPEDWSAHQFDVAALPPAGSLSASDGVRVRLYGPTTGDWKEWRFGTGDGLSEGSFGSVGATTASTADATSGSPDMSSIVRYEVRVNVVGAAAGKVWRLDSWRITRTDGAIQEVDVGESLPMIASELYALEYRVPLDSPPRAHLVVHAIRDLASFGVTSDRLVHRLYLQSPDASATKPDAGLLHSFGVQDLQSGRWIVREKAAGPQQTARVTLVDEAPGVHAVAGVLPSFSPSVSFPVSPNVLGPPAPVVIDVVADERALAQAGDGSLQARILLMIRPGSIKGRPRARELIITYRPIAPAGIQAAKLKLDADVTQVTIEGVDQGTTYHVTLQTVSADGRASAVVQRDVIVSGSTNRPPDVQGFRQQDGQLRWELPFIPLYLAGFRISRTNPDGTYVQSRSIHGDMLIAGPPFDLARIMPGFGRLFIVAVDRAGNESAIPAVISGFLGSTVEQNIVNTIDLAALGFPGTDVEEPVLDGFEGLVPKETADNEIEVPRDVELGARLYDVLTGSANSLIYPQRSSPLVGLQSLRMEHADSSSLTLSIPFGWPLNVEDASLALKLRCNKSTVWIVSVRVIESADPTKWIEFFIASSGSAIEEMSFSVNDTPAATGPGGVPDLTAIGSLLITQGRFGAASGDHADYDDIRWVGGAFNGVEVVGGELVNRSNSGSFWSDNSGAPFWNFDPMASFWQTVKYLPGRYRFSITPTNDDLPSDLRFDIEAAPATEWSLFYRTAQSSFWSGNPDEPFWSADPSEPFWLGGIQDEEFVEFPGVLRGVGHKRYEFELRLDALVWQGKITALTAILDVEDEREPITDFVVASSGTVRLPITKTYREIRSAPLQVQDDGNNGFSYRILDKDAELGPSVAVYNSSGSRVQGLVSGSVEGVRG